jgi:CheY-like chemotaxis protein
MTRILIVDDDTLVLASVQMLLIHAGHEVRAVDQARNAVRALEREPFDLVIVDVFMPGMDGYQAIKEFQRARPGHSGHRDVGRHVPRVIPAARTGLSRHGGQTGRDPYPEQAVQAGGTHGSRPGLRRSARAAFRCAQAERCWLIRGGRRRS